MSDVPMPDPMPVPGPDLPEPDLPGPSDPEPDQPMASAFDPRMLEALVCPQTHGTLAFDRERQELVSRSAHLAYPIRAGIPIMLLSEARALD